MVHSVLRLRLSNRTLSLEFDVFPGIGIASAPITREDVLPFRRLDARPDPVHESMAEHWHEVVALENLPLDLFGQRLALFRFVGSQIFGVFSVKFRNAELVGGEHAAA